MSLGNECLDKSLVTKFSLTNNNIPPSLWFDTLYKGFSNHKFGIVKMEM